MHTVEHTLRFGEKLSAAKLAVILVHGRGGSAQDIAGIANHLPRAGVAYFAPEATGNVWYPQRFFVPQHENEPWLSSALDVVSQLVDEAGRGGLLPRQVALVGFSQGACLSLEAAARAPRRYAFVGGLSGALVGPLDTPRPPADLNGTPVLLGCAESDAHIPLEYVEHSAVVMARMKAVVTKQIQPGGNHTLFPQEIEWLRQQVAAAVAPTPA